MGSYLFIAVMLGAIWFLNRNFASFKGMLGERHVKNILSALNPAEYSLLNDLYIPKEHGQTTQVDHLLVSQKGIFVIETKNYKGWITGSEHSQYWTQTNYKRKDKLYNPIWQNSGHIKALQEYLGDISADIPIYSIIVFGKEATLKFKEPFKKAYVVKSKDLNQTIHSISGPDTLSNFKQEKIKQHLITLDLKDKKLRNEVKKKHVQDIKKDMKAKKEMVSGNICPRCGNPLVSRQGKRGPFKGCSSYPKCRFIA